jgi:catechol 2,3-dioxygenase
MDTPYLVPAGTRIGHIHLQVTDLDKALAFYQGILGFEITQRYGDQAVFLSADGYHHHIGLNTWHSRGGRPAQREGAAGLYHAAILYPTRADLARVLRQLQKAGYPLRGAADHGVSEALYLDDPDGNGIELYWDRPEAEWPRTADGGIEMYTRALDVAGLLAAGN